MNSSSGTRMHRFGGIIHLMTFTLVVLLLCMYHHVPGVYADDSTDDDPFQCAAQQYIGECCMPGSYPLSLGITQCAPGFYCPFLTVNDTLITSCPPTPTCQAQRLASNQCPSPQGKHEPILCPAGQLCATPATMELCPDGYFCPPGTHSARDCGPMSYCPPGTSRRVYLGAILMVAIADVVLMGIVALYRYTRRQAHALHLRQMKHTGIEASIISTSQHYTLPRPTRKLCKGFNKAKGELREMDFVFTNLSMKLPSGQMILTGVNGQVKPGKVTAIMGPSGAGKTTFLYTLTGKMDSKCVRGGELTINGQQAELSAFKKVVGYVPQDDVMMRELTVWDNIMHSARIRLPHWSKAEVEGHVRAVIEAMGLVDVSGIKIGDELSRGISGGQRKRVNIGMELAAAPLALFLDEPTSGLDSTAAMDVCNLLRDIAQETGITVAMVIHQPRVEIWNHLDDILLLAPGGRTVYLGPQSKAQRYFESHLAVEVRAHENPADVIMDMIAENGDSYAKKWLLSGRDYLSTMPAVAIIPAPKSPWSPVDVHTDEKKNLLGHQSSTVSVAARSGTSVAARYEAVHSNNNINDVLEGGNNQGAATATTPAPPVHPFAVPSSNPPMVMATSSSKSHINSGTSSRPTTPARRDTNTANGNATANNANGALSSRLAAPSTQVANSPQLQPGTGVTNSPHSGGMALGDTSSLTAVPPLRQRTNSGTPVLGTAHVPAALSPRTTTTVGNGDANGTTNGHGSVKAPSPTLATRQGFGGGNSNNNTATSPKDGDILLDIPRRGSHVSRHGRKESQIVIVAREPRGAPLWRQFLLCHIRSLKQQHEKLSALALEAGVSMFAGFLMGVGGGAPHQGVLVVPYSLLSPAPLEFLIPQMCMFINMSIGLAGASAGVKAFGEERVVYWREAGAGHSPTAYFLGVATASFYRIALSALHFSMVYHLLSAPLIGFGELVLLTSLIFYAVYGVAAIVSMVLQRENAPLLAVVISLFAAVFGGYVESLPEFLKLMSYAFWSSEAMYDRSVSPFRGIYQVDEVSAPLWHYTLGRFGFDLWIIFVIGTLYRIVSYILMLGLNRDKQR